MRRNYGAYIAHTDRQFADNAQASGEEKREVGAKPKSRSIRASKNTSIGSNSVGLEACLFIDNIEVFSVAASSW